MKRLVLFPTAASLMAVRRTTLAFLIAATLLMALFLGFGGEQLAGAQSQSKTPLVGTGSVAWGDNTEGQLGDGSALPKTSTSSSNTPVKTRGLTGLKDIAAGANHSLALGVSQGKVWAWGDDAEGQLGDDSTRTDRRTPEVVSNLMSITHVAAGGKHSLALEGNGTVWAWGDGTHGQLGDRNDTDRLTPVEVAGDDLGGLLTDVKDVAAGANHSLALKNDGTVWTWGSNGAGQLGTGSTSFSSSNTPVQVAGDGPGGLLTDVKDIAAGHYHSLALKNDGTVWAWGYNVYGQLGNDSTNNSSSTPVQVSDLSGVTDVAGGERHSLALKNDGTVWTWGSDGDGQLGTEATSDEYRTPLKVDGLTSMTDVTGGMRHSLALKSDGTAWSWGENYNGQLGDGTNTDRSTPVQVKGEGPGGFLNEGMAVAGGGKHSMTMVRDATPPTTEATPSPQPNAAGWHDADVTLSLSASDGNFGTGVREIKYSATGAQQIAQQTVQGDTATLPAITTEGETTISYYATDKGGNTESPAKTFTVKLDKTAPDAVTGLSGVPGDAKADLSWTNPTASDFDKVRVLRSTSAVATSPEPGSGQTQVYEGTATSYSDTGLTNGTTYYYTVFARDTAGNWSSATSISATPVLPDTTAPDAVTGLSAAPGDAKADLSWTNPTASDFDKVRVLRSTSAAATSPEPGSGQEKVYEGNDTKYSDAGLTNGTEYYYTVFARDTAGNWSSAASTNVTPTASPPPDTVPPTVDEAGLKPSKFQTRVRRGTDITARFSEEMKLATLVTTPKDPADPTVGTSSNVKLERFNKKKKKWWPVNGVEVSCNTPCDKVTLDPFGDSTSKLLANTKYRVTITTGAKDKADNALTNNFSWTFKTGER